LKHQNSTLTEDVHVGTEEIFDQPALRSKKRHPGYAPDSQFCPGNQSSRCAEGIPQGRAEGFSQSGTEGVAQSSAEGIPQSGAEGISQGRREGVAQGGAAGIIPVKRESALVS
jgi:hypothetical protein